MRVLRVAIALLALAGARPARADQGLEGPPPAPPAPVVARRVSVTASAIEAFMPMLRVAAEVRLPGRLAVAGYAGLGIAEAEYQGGTHDAVLAGAGVRWYARGRFERGFQLGADVVLRTVPSDPVRVTVPFPQGWSLASYGGYKYVFRSGFTLEIQLGLRYLLVRREIFPNFEDDDNRLGPHFELCGGWSF